MSPISPCSLFLEQALDLTLKQQVNNYSLDGILVVPISVHMYVVTSFVFPYQHRPSSMEQPVAGPSNPSQRQGFCSYCQVVYNSIEQVSYLILLFCVVLILTTSHAG